MQRGSSRYRGFSMSLEIKKSLGTGELRYQAAKSRFRINHGYPLIYNFSHGRRAQHISGQTS